MEMVRSRPIESVPPSNLEDPNPSGVALEPGGHAHQQRPARPLPDHQESTQAFDRAAAESENSLQW